MEAVCVRSPQDLIKYLLFSSDIEYFGSRIDGERRRRSFFIFMFLSVLIEGGSGVVGWSRKSSARSAETASFCCWFYSRMEDTG